MVAEACARQKEGGISKALSSGLGLATGATTWWGCTGVTCDQQFPQYVSSNAEDEELGSKNFEQALTEVSKDTIIMLDEFNDEQRKKILLTLQAHSVEDGCCLARRVEQLRLLGTY